jgi:hypothetical protein
MKKKPKKKSRASMMQLSPNARNTTHSGQKEIEINLDVPDHLKISNALSKLIASETRYCFELGDYQFLVDIAVVAWNFCVVSSRMNMQPTIEYFSEVVNEKYNQEILDAIFSFVNKKQILFPKDMRLIVVWDVKLEGKNIRITAGTNDTKDKTPSLLNI